jgi:hypothetical protein
MKRSLHRRRVTRLALFVVGTSLSGTTRSRPSEGRVLVAAWLTVPPPPLFSGRSDAPCIVPKGNGRLRTRTWRLEGSLTVDPYERDQRIREDMELASHDDRDKMEYGHDVIRGSINVTNIAVTDAYASMDPSDRNGEHEPTSSWGASQPRSLPWWRWWQRSDPLEPPDGEEVTTAPFSKLDANATEPSTHFPDSASVRSAWRRRNARSAEEGIRREKTTQLSSLLAKAGSIDPTIQQGRRYAARTITGLINALAEEVADLNVEVDARRSTPLWGKHVDAVKIKFSRLGFKPLRMGGLDDTLRLYDETFPHTAVNSFTRPLSDVPSADEAFAQIDIDNSGALDPDEIARALNLAANSASDDATAEDPNSLALLKDLATDLVQLYDFDGDGAVDRTEYQRMVEDMAALRAAQKARQAEATEKESHGWLAPVKHFFGGLLSGSADKKDTEDGFLTDPARSTASPMFRASSGDLEVAEPIADSDADAKAIQKTRDIVNLSDSPGMVDSMAKALGSITLSDLKLDLRRLVFGAIPVLKHITPGGPLILEPFTATVNGSFNREDIMSSFLLDAGLRRLVARVLRIRVRSVRDLMDGAVFVGRSWNDKSPTAPRVEVPELTNIEFDKQNRLIITGRARVCTNPGAPKINQAFKVRTKIGAGQDGRFIRLVEPELAFVLECPTSWEKSIGMICETLNIKVPARPRPLYSFFPIYSPFKLEDNDGFDLGEDNHIKSIYVQDGALQFEMSAVLRPGRFLGNHYLAFTIPNRTFIITLERVKEGIRAARKIKQEGKALDTTAKLQASTRLRNGIQAPVTAKAPFVETPSIQRTQPKSFFSRFVDGYLQSERDEAKQERAVTAIRDFFGRQIVKDSDGES